jgi:ribosomal protein S18 acetylase RimI-like enzyme
LGRGAFVPIGSKKALASGATRAGAVVVWATLRGARSVRFMVTSRYEAAIRFYRRLGFVMTGRTEPYPNDLALIEHEMAQSI